MRQVIPIDRPSCSSHTDSDNIKNYDLANEMVRFCVHRLSEPEPNPLGPELMVQSKVRAEGSNPTQGPVLGSDDRP
jgi:hypothetical protein